MKPCLNLLLTCAAAVLLGGDYASCREYASYEEYTYYEESRLDSHRTKELASAPTIVLGKIVAIKHTGLDKLMSRVDPQFINSRGTKVDVYQISVAVERKIKGAIEGREIVVEALLLPRGGGNSFDLQVLATDKRFVFFLTRRKGDKQWVGFSPFAFALRVEAVTALGDDEKLSANEQLQRIAKANTRKADELCAADWIAFLEQVYNKKDQKFLLAMMDDPRLRIRGEALAILCEHHPKTPGLYDKAMKFVDDTDEGNPGYGMVRAQVIDHLLKPLDHFKSQLRNRAINTLLKKGDDRLAEVALAAIRDRRYSDLEPGVVKLMMRSKDRELQYHCIKTLYSLNKRSYLPTHIFLKDPEKYINEFK